MSCVLEIETTRLVGQCPRAEHFELLRQLLQNSQVMATLGDIPSNGEVQEFLASYLAHWDRYGFGRWLWHTKPLSPGGRGKGEGDEVLSGAKSEIRFVGRAGLNTVEIDGQSEVEIGYALLPEFWNQGFATEMTQAIIRVAFQEGDLAELVCFTLPTNVASRRVMEKAGFIFERNFIWKNLPHVLYRLKR